MNKDFSDLSVEDIKKGYTFNSSKKMYACNICSKKFELGEVFKFQDKYFDAKKMIQIHIKNEHSNLIEILANNKYSNLTDKQKSLFYMMAKGMSDKEIAKKNNVSSSTIRHQRFVLREKSKQAKLFLALYELTQKEIANLDNKNNDKLINIHKGAKMIDDRYFITEKEESRVLKTLFSSLDPLKLKTFSSKEKKKIIILRRISKEFDENSKYSEKEINEIIKNIYKDISTIRRYLIEYGFLARKRDGSEYWVKTNP